MRFEKVWVEQCRATKAIKRRFGAKSALDYLIGEKLMTFADAARDDPPSPKSCRDFWLPSGRCSTNTRLRATSPVGNQQPETVFDTFCTYVEPASLLENQAAGEILGRRCAGSKHQGGSQRLAVPTRDSVATLNANWTPTLTASFDTVVSSWCSAACRISARPGGRKACFGCRRRAADDGARRRQPDWQARFHDWMIHVT